MSKTKIQKSLIPAKAVVLKPNNGKENVVNAIVGTVSNNKAMVQKANKLNQAYYLI